MSPNEHQTSTPATPRWAVWKVVVFGQLLAAILAACGITSTALAARGVSVPATQSFLNYLLTGAVYGTLHLSASRSASRAGKAVKQPSTPPPRGLWWKCAAVAALDVEATYMNVLAYRYTSLTSVTLLDCTTIPEVLLLSWLLLGARYRPAHVAGALLAILGSSILVLSDSKGGVGDGPRPLLGDGLVLIGATMYAVLNIAEERLLDTTGRIELLAKVGTLGCLLCALQATALESDSWSSIPLTPQVLGLFAGFSAAFFAFTSLVPLMLMHGGSAALNLSLLASDFWAAAARALFFGGFGGTSAWAFASALALVALGLALFSLAGEVSRPERLVPYEQLEEQLGAPAAAATAAAEKPPDLEAEQGHPGVVLAAAAPGDLQPLQACEMQAAPAVYVALPAPVLRSR